MVQLDVELIVRSMRQSGQTKVVEFPGEIGLRVQVDDGLSNRVDFTTVDYVPRDLTPGRAVGTATDRVINRSRRG